MSEWKECEYVDKRNDAHYISEIELLKFRCDNLVNAFVHQKVLLEKNKEEIEYWKNRCIDFEKENQQKKY